MDLKAHAEQAATAKKRQHKFLDKIKKAPPKDLDQVVLDAHETAFEEIDCLTCANCCKTISPIFIPKDIERIAQYLGMKAGAFTEKYLRIDADGDYVLQSSPCPFLLPDNCCKVYDVRPRACAGYPHTDERKFHLHIGITKKNLEVCPAAYKVVLMLEAAYAK